MKRFILLLIATFTMACGFAQNTNIKEACEKLETVTDSLTEDQKDELFNLAEQILITRVDSIMHEGIYMQALELMDSIQAN